MNNFWQNLSDRERMLVMVGGALALVLIVTQLIIAPINGWRADQRQRLEEAESLYRLVAEAAPRAGAKAASDADLETPLRSAISQSSSAAGVPLVYVNARGDNAVDANAASVDPALLFDWLQLLNRQYGVVVASADISRESGNPRVVRAQLSLERVAAP